MKFLISAALSLTCVTVSAAPVAINTSDATTIAASLSGIGLSKAQKIVDYCQANGCHKPEDLLNIKGIGPKTLERISPDLIFSEQTQNQTQS